MHNVSSELRRTTDVATGRLGCHRHYLQRTNFFRPLAPESYHSVALRDLKAKATPGETLDTLGQEGTDAGQEREYARKGDN